MKTNILSLLVILLYAVKCAGQETCVLENRFRNPIDTTSIIYSEEPCLVLFVHSKCGHQCATQKMQEYLETDSCLIRKKYGIKLYVVYPLYSEKNIKDFDSYTPQNSEILFWVDKPKYFYGFENTTPYIVFFNKGKVKIQSGGTYRELMNLIINNIQDRRNSLGKQVVSSN